VREAKEVEDMAITVAGVVCEGESRPAVYVANIRGAWFQFFRLRHWRERTAAVVTRENTIWRRQAAAIRKENAR